MDIIVQKCNCFVKLTVLICATDKPVNLCTYTSVRVYRYLWDHGEAAVTVTDLVLG